MKTSDKLQDVLKQEGQKLKSSPKFAEIQEFYIDMEQKGLVVRQEYRLPPLDTIGRNIYHQTNLTQGATKRFV